MKIKMYEIPIREIITGYEDNEIGGVVGFHGKLNIRPAYQREFIYKDKQRDDKYGYEKVPFERYVLGMDRCDR